MVVHHVCKRTKKPYEIRTRAILDVCRFCKEPYLTIPARRQRGNAQGQYCSRTCGSRASGGNRGLRGENSPHWKGGRRQSGQGYVEVYSPDHPSVQGTKRMYVREHRLVMEQKLGRLLERWEEVHHINGIRNDNRPENLELWVHSQPAGVRMEQAIKHCPSCMCNSNLN